LVVCGSISERPTIQLAAAAADDGCWRQGPAAAETKRLLRLAGPMVASCFLQNAVNIMSLMFVGHLGKLHLAGASLAISVTSATGLNIIVRRPCLHPQLLLPEVHLR
jgi:MATE family multidrug resistance protein